MKVYIGNINEYTIEELKPMVSEDRFVRSMKYRFEADRKRSLLAHSLLGHALSDKYPGIMLPVNPSVDEYGKPHIFFEGSEVFFSVSHSGDHAVCAVNDAPIGVDIELIDKENDAIARRFFSKDELQYINDKKSFYRIWTLKESFMKVTGLGMRLPMDRYSVTDLDLGTGTCRFKTNPDHVRDTEDASVAKRLSEFLSQDSSSFNITGRFMIFNEEYSLALAAQGQAQNVSLLQPAMAH